ncbi:MAG: pro-sigmaK processing inhibitor BofA family protein [Firmicutes bacterium]|nr:pro-sigmaK processing inhibitor BofA family protein [Bacillota bacterium]
MSVEMGVFLTFGGTLILLFLLGKALLMPLKIILKMAMNSLLGGLILVIINAFGSVVGLMIPLNLINAVTVGVLGVPGVVMLLLFCN